ncbi:MAG: PAS domain S-box protein, partial [Rhodothermales bacterium]|nr:PAS domain S-box protein [Rhodothermales bacterium]
LAFTDGGIEDSSLYWIVLLPLLSAFMVGPWLSAICATVIVAGVFGLYVLEVQGYAFPHLSTPSDVVWYSLLSLVSATLFATLLGWVYEGHTLRRLRRMNARLQELQGALEESEARYRSLFSNIPVGVYRSDPNGRILMANPALVEMLGFQDLDEFATFDLEHIYAGTEGRVPFRERMKRDGQVRQFETALRRRDGEVVYVRENAKATFDADGAVLFYEGTVEDVTAQRQAKLALRASEERFRALVQNSTDTVTVIDEGGVVQYQSPSVEQHLGYTAEELQGGHILEIVHPKDRARLTVLFRQHLRQEGALGTVEFRCRHADGHYIYVEAVGTNMLHNPAVGGIVLNSRDVTERKRAERALVQAKEQAEEVARMKGAFLANMSHEIRTPLTGILGFADVLYEEVDEPHQEFVGLIRRSGKRLLDTLNSVLDLARLEADQMEVELRTLDVVEHTREVVRLLGSLAREKGLDLRVEGEERTVYARLDAGCLSRVLNNLVGNAIKFTEHGCITVRVTDEGGHATVEVADTGVGIESAFVPYLFEEFKQESSGIERSHEGSGLGLTITKKLVEIMHGRIEVESRKGEGSTFRVRFPSAAPVEVRSEAEADEEAAHSGTLPHVLVLDDNDSALLLIGKMLRGVCTCDAVSTVSEALRLASERAYDLVLLDIHLSEEVTGVEVMRQLRQMEDYADTPVVAFTAFALPGDRERFINAGFNGYFSKPFTRSSLLQLVREVMAERPPRVAEGDDGSSGPPPANGSSGPSDGDAFSRATFLSG